MFFSYETFVNKLIIVIPSTDIDNKTINVVLESLTNIY